MAACPIPIDDVRTPRGHWHEQSPPSGLPKSRGGSRLVPMIGNRPLVLPSYFPVPVNCEVCGLLPALSLTLRVPVRVPVAAGLNTTSMVHFPLPARVVVQVVEETAKSPELEITMLFSVAFRLLVSVNAWEPLVLPSPTPVGAPRPKCDILPAHECQVVPPPRAELNLRNPTQGGMPQIRLSCFNIHVFMEP